MTYITFNKQTFNDDIESVLEAYGFRVTMPSEAPVVTYSNYYKGKQDSMVKYTNGVSAQERMIERLIEIGASFDYERTDRSKDVTIKAYGRALPYGGVLKYIYPQTDAVGNMVVDYTRIKLLEGKPDHEIAAAVRQIISDNEPAGILPIEQCSLDYLQNIKLPNDKAACLVVGNMPKYYGYFELDYYYPEAITANECDLPFDKVLSYEFVHGGTIKVNKVFIEPQQFSLSIEKGDKKTNFYIRSWDEMKYALVQTLESFGEELAKETDKSLPVRLPDSIISEIDEVVDDAIKRGEHVSYLSATVLVNAEIAAFLKVYEELISYRDFEYAIEKYAHQQFVAKNGNCA